MLHGVEVGIFTAGSALGERLEQAEPEAERDTEVRAAVQEGVGEGQSAWSRGSNVQVEEAGSRETAHGPLSENVNAEPLLLSPLEVHRIACCVALSRALHRRDMRMYMPHVCVQVRHSPVCALFAQAYLCCVTRARSGARQEAQREGGIQRTSPAEVGAHEGASAREPTIRT